MSKSHDNSDSSDYSDYSDESQKIDEYLDIIIAFLPSTYKYVKTLEDRNTGSVYLFDNTGDNSIPQIVVKTEYNRKECLYYEFLVGMELNKLNSPHIVKTLGFYEKDNIGILILEYINGKILQSYYRELGKSKSVDLCLITLSVIQQINTITNFTHYDLHAGNVILVKTNTPVQYPLKIQDDIKIINSNFIVKIIDFGRSYIQSIDNQWAESSLDSLCNGVVPSVYDDMYDLCKIMTAFTYEFYARNDHLIDFFKNNSFNMDYYEIFKTISGIRNVTRWGGQITTWYSSLRLSTIDASIGKQFYINKQYTNSCDFSATDITQYDPITQRKKLSDCITYLKRLSITQRPNTLSQLLQFSYNVLMSL